MRESHTAVIERNTTWRGAFASEPYECAWAGEAIFFVRCLAADGLDENAGANAGVQISPDGMHWCGEGTSLHLPTAADAVTFARVSHFGGWLRLVGELPEGTALTVLVYLVLKE
ncbi:MAG: hypothetical protein KF753_08440 [Caldilineaceae bacterium]|nr:hypothetical protein [Caldilineaceae bacterium]